LWNSLDDERYQTGLASKKASPVLLPGEMDDDEDAVVWAGLVEMLDANEKRLQGLEG
jgi:hypothetical protein